MSLSHSDDLLSRSREFLDAAQDSFEKERYNVAYDDARQAAELACKAILQETEGDYPRSHEVQGRMFQRDRIPDGIEARELSRLLGDYNRGRYAFDDPVDEDEARDALKLARTLHEAARSA